MEWLWIPVLAAAVALLLSWFCFHIVFFSSRRKPFDEEAVMTPSGAVYDPFRPQMEQWIRQTRAMPGQRLSIRSFDGLILCGTYYEYAPGAPIELMFHGYRGTSERDLCGGVQRCFALGHSALIVDQRGCGRSGGDTITFGIREKRDCRAWVELAVSTWGPDCRIILTGISMGASTVLMAAGGDLPEQVVGVLADCGFTGAEDIIKKVMRQIHLPASLLYPFVAWGARIFGRFDVGEDSALEAMGRCRLPVIFFHGEADDYVPCDMSRRNYEACTARKMLVTVPGAGHGLSFPVAPDCYLAAMREFFGPELCPGTDRVEITL